MANRVVYTFLGKDSFTAAAKRIQKATRRTRAQFRLLSKDAKKTEQILNRTKTAGKRIGVAAAAGAVVSLKAFGDLQSGVTNVLTLMDSPAEVTRFRSGMEGLAEGAIKMGFSIEDSTTALFNNISALGANEQAMGAFEVAQKLAVGGVTTLDTSVSGIAAVMNAYGKEVTSASDVANAFFTAQKKGTTTVAALAFNVGKVAPIAKTMGVGFKTLLATMAQLTQGGLSTEEATTALRATLTALQNPTEQAKRVLVELGVPFGVTAVRAAGLTETLLALARASETNIDAIALAIPNVRALTGVFALGEKEIRKIDLTVNQINKDIAAGTGLNKAFTMQMGQFNRQMAMTRGTLTLLAAGLGEKLAPSMEIMGKAIRDSSDAFMGMNNASKEFLGTALTVVTVMGSIGISVGIVMALMGKAALVATGLAFVFSAPFIAVAVAVAATVAAITVLLNNWQLLKDSFRGGIFGNDAEVNVTGSGEISTLSKMFSQIELTVNAPKDVVSGIKTKSSGPGSMSIGVNNVETL